MEIMVKRPNDIPRFIMKVIELGRCRLYELSDEQVDDLIATVDDCKLDDINGVTFLELPLVAYLITLRATDVLNKLHVCFGLKMNITWYKDQTSVRFCEYLIKRETKEYGEHSSIVQDLKELLNLIKSEKED